MSRRRPVPVPLVPPWAAYVIARDFGAQLEQKARDMAAAQPEVSRQLLVAVEQLREVGRQVVGAQLERRGSGGQAGGGSAEVPEPAGGSELGCPPSPGLTTGQVAAMFEAAGFRISDRQVRNLIAGTVLVATWKGRAYVVDEVSVAREIERRQALRER